MRSLALPYQTVDHVVAAFGELEGHFRRAGDRRCIFLTLYGVVSTAIRERIARRAFRDTAWVERYAVAFANLYRVALQDYEAAQLARVPKAWRICFDAAKAGDGLVLQDVLLGVNAHVNNDLPLALTSISIDPDRAGRYRDHSAVNEVLASVTDRATERLAALYAPGLRRLDEAAGQVDELLSAFSLDVARESAWEGAVALTGAPGGEARAITSRLISARAAVVARLLRAPSHSPAFVRASRLLEQQPDWRTILERCVAGS